MYKLATISALLIALGIIAGAFGAHALKDYFQGTQEEVWKTAVFYQLINSLGILVLFSITNSSLDLLARIKAASCLILAGVLIFSASLYLLVLTNIKWLGAITPIGGSCLIIGWLMVTRAFWQFSRSSSKK